MYRQVTTVKVRTICDGCWNENINNFEPSGIPGEIRCSCGTINYRDVFPEFTSTDGVLYFKIINSVYIQN